MSFLASLPPHGASRDAFLLRAIARGDLDPPRWYRLRMGRAEIDVSRDYLTIGGERCPMSAPVAQAAVDSLDALLPTPAIVDAIEHEPAAIVTWLPTQTPGPGQISADAFARCERETVEILAGYLGSDTALLAGHRKDVVIAPSMRQGRVTIYGARWSPEHKPNPRGRIQPVSSVHEEGYADYSHAVRAVRRACLLDGRPARLEDVLAAGLCGGPVARLRYPTPAPEPRPTPTISAVLRRGDRGPQVVELQTLLSASGYATACDGIFGPGTEASVKGFQSAHGLVVDGLAGPRTITALRSLGDTERPPAPGLDLDSIPFVQARNYHPGRQRPLRCIVLHTAEITEVADAAERLAAWASGPSAPMASWHFAVDADTIVRCVRDEDTAFAAPGLNSDGLQVEMSGRAAQGPDGWADAYSQAVLERTARLVAALCRRHGLPVAFVDAAGLLRGESGITTHAEVTKAYKRSTHTDPGASFPREAFLAAVKRS